MIVVKSCGKWNTPIGAKQIVLSHLADPIIVLKLHELSRLVEGMKLNFRDIVQLVGMDLHN